MRNCIFLLADKNMEATLISAAKANRPETAEESEFPNCKNEVYLIKSITPPAVKPCVNMSVT